MSRQTTEQQALFTRQAIILRKNLQEWDRMIRNQHGEDWPKMLGRLNAALNQTSNLDRCIDDVMEHFVYIPKKSTANAQDIPFFLSTRLEMSDNTTAETATKEEESNKAAAAAFKGDPVKQLTKYERNAAQLAADYEETMVRF